MDEKIRICLLKCYKEEKVKLAQLIDFYRKNYVVTSSQDGPRGIEFEEYEKARIDICKIRDEQERMQQTALLQIRILNGHLDSLDKVLEEIREKNV